MVKKVKQIPTIETVWKKKFITKDQYIKILKHMGSLEFADFDDPEECENIMNISRKIIKGLLDRAILLDVYKDMTSDLYCTPNLSIINPTMRKLFIYLGPEGKNTEIDSEYRIWREL